MNQLAINRYTFNFKVETPLQLNFYSGSMLRGSFGHALRQISCMTKLKDCKSCPLYPSCPYTNIFEPAPLAQSSLQSFSQVPAPYIIEPPALGEKHYKVGDMLSFSMVLMGQAIEQLPLIIYAWQQALNRGISKYKSQASLIDVSYQTDSQQQQIIYQHEQSNAVMAHKAIEFSPIESKNKLTLRFKTPLRIQQRGKTLSNDMSARDFLMSLVRRYYLLQELYGLDYQAPDFANLAELSTAIEQHNQFSWCDWTRYSSRQQQKMTLGGVLGEITLTGDLSPFLEILHQGQWLHVGNKTSFGMGHYQLKAST